MESLSFDYNVFKFLSFMFQIIGLSANDKNMELKMCLLFKVVVFHAY